MAESAAGQAAGQGLALTAIAAERSASVAAALAAPVASLPTAIARESATFLVNGKSFAAQYEVRTTLWEVLAVKLGLSDARILDHLYLSAFSRYPTDAEKAPLLDALHQARASAGSPEVRRDAHRQALEDMMWAMLTSKEFLFNY